MSRDAIEVGAFTWSRVRRLYDEDPTVHFQRCEAEGFVCPEEVFGQLFHAEADNAEFAALVKSVDWGRVFWELKELSGISLRQVRVDRGYQQALDEARSRATQLGIRDDREDVLEHWRVAHSWRLPPVMVAGTVFGSNVGYELLVGCTRLGNLLGLLERQDIPEVKRHWVWVGR
jgi:hypothetical protein